MKKVLYVFILGCMLIFGMMAGRPNRNTAANEIEDEIDDFEDIITDPSNDFSPDDRSEIDPNISNDLAKTGENIISGVFDFALGLFEKLI